MELQKLYNNVESELNNIALKGINMENLDVAWKLTDIYKNCIKIKAMSEPEVYMSQSEYVKQLEGIMQNASPEDWEAVRKYLS